MSLPLLQTKLYAPPPRPQLVQRDQLPVQLRDPDQRPLISAPASFGKTTLVSEWATQASQAIGWLALDEDDNDLLRFLTYLVAALQTLFFTCLHSVKLLYQPKRCIFLYIQFLYPFPLPVAKFLRYSEFAVPFICQISLHTIE